MIGSQTTKHKEIISVPLDKAVPVPVVVSYLVVRDASYGADSDGRRGVVSEEILIDDAYVCPGRLLVPEDLTSEDVENALAIARWEVEGR